MRRILIIFSLCWLFAPSMFAQRKQTANCDSLAYYTYLSDTFAKYYPLEVIGELHDFFNYEVTDTAKSNIVKENYTPGIIRANPLEQGYPVSTIMIGREDGTGFSRTYQNPKFPFRLLKPYKACLRNCMEKYHKKTNKSKLVRNLQDFKAQSNHYPYFFQTIDSVYHGNVESYVKDLFKESILLNVRRSDKFINEPSAERFNNDIGVQFVLTLWQYEKWLEDRQLQDTADD